MFNRNFFKVFAVLFIIYSPTLQAQDLPGTEVSPSQVNQDAITLVNLASQQFPALFSNGTPWRVFGGFYFKYFTSSGIYLGVNDGNLYLLGGPFGSEASIQGRVSDAVALLSGNTQSTGAVFDDFASATTLKDLLTYFTTLTVSYDTISSFIDLRAAVSLEVQGKEDVGGVSADKLIVTVSGNNLPQSQTYQMWVDNDGIIIRVVEPNGFEFVMPSSNLIGSGVISSMLLSLAAAESPVVQAAITEELASPSVTTKTVDASISGVPVKTLAIEVGDQSTATILFEISDFGSFSMTSKLESTLAGTTTRFELKDIVLR